MNIKFLFCNLLSIKLLSILFSCIIWKKYLKVTCIDWKMKYIISRRNSLWKKSILPQILQNWQKSVNQRFPEHSARGMHGWSAPRKESWSWNFAENMAISQKAVKRKSIIRRSKSAFSSGICGGISAIRVSVWCFRNSVICCSWTVTPCRWSMSG